MGGHFTQDRGGIINQNKNEKIKREKIRRLLEGRKKKT